MLTQLEEKGKVWTPEIPDKTLPGMLSQAVLERLLEITFL